MRVTLVTPAPPRSRNGNRVTALRWARICRDLGHRVDVVEAWAGQQSDILIGLHARRSHDSIVRFKEAHPDRPLVVALTGTDLYGDIHTDLSAKASLELADRFIVLQSEGVNELPARFRDLARVVVQSFT